MCNLFPVIEVPDDAAETEEAMGTKFKFWYRHPHLGDCLFKQARSNTGEDWSEKIAAELCQLLDIPHASYELSLWRGQRGILSPNLLPPNTALLHGNDILAALVSYYPRQGGYNLSQHTLSLVLNAINKPGVQPPLGWNLPQGINSATAAFVGYLMLDAWIGNGDRHHENWGFVVSLAGGIAHLSPTYDHASCLGRELLDDKRHQRLEQNTVRIYAEKARSAFYLQETDKKPLLTFELFDTIAQMYPHSANLWLNRLAQISSDQVRQLFRCIPNDRISPIAIEFACQMLDINKERLLRKQETLI